MLLKAFMRRYFVTLYGTTFPLNFDFTSFKKSRFFSLKNNLKILKIYVFMFLIFKSEFLLFHVKLCRLNFYEFIGFVAFNIISMHELLWVAFFLIIYKNMVPPATVRTLK